MESDAIEFIQLAISIYIYYTTYYIYNKPIYYSFTDIRSVENRNKYSMKT